MWSFEWLDLILVTNRLSSPLAVANMQFLFIRYQIMLKCWEEIPSDRPTFAKLKETMKEMNRNHKVSLAEALFVTCHLCSVMEI